MRVHSHPSALKLTICSSKVLVSSCSIPLTWSATCYISFWMMQEWRHIVIVVNAKWTWGTNSLFNTFLTSSSFLLLCLILGPSGAKTGPNTMCKRMLLIVRASWSTAISYKIPFFCFPTKQNLNCAKKLSMVSYSIFMYLSGSPASIPFVASFSISYQHSM